MLCDVFNCNEVLQASGSKIITNFIFFLLQIPKGLCLKDLTHLCILEPEMFGEDCSFFLQISSLNTG